MSRSAPKPLTERPGSLLSQVGFHSAELFAAGLAPLGLRPRHFGLLSQLAAADGLDPAERRELVHLLRRVAERAGLAPGVRPGLRRH